MFILRRHCAYIVWHITDNYAGPLSTSLMFRIRLLAVSALIVRFKTNWPHSKIRDEERGRCFITVRLRDSDTLQFHHLLSVLPCCLHKLWHSCQASAMNATCTVVCRRSKLVSCVDRLAIVGGPMVVVTSIQPTPVPFHCLSCGFLCPGESLAIGLSFRVRIYMICGVRWVLERCWRWKQHSESRTFVTRAHLWRQPKCDAGLPFVLTPKSWSWTGYLPGIGYEFDLCSFFSVTVCECVYVCVNVCV
jgi:hypothetical protein